MKKTIAARKASTALGVVLTLGLGAVGTPSAQAQTETILYNFPSGAQPRGTLVMDTSGNLYGTTIGGGSSTNCQGGCGAVFKLDSMGNETILHSFTGAPGDGTTPQAGLVMDAAGNLYGTTVYWRRFDELPGRPSGVGVYGTVFKVSPSGNETVLCDSRE